MAPDLTDPHNCLKSKDCNINFKQIKYFGALQPEAYCLII